MVSLFREQAGPVSVQDPLAARDFYMQLRQTGDGLTAVLWNKSRTHTYENVPVAITAPGQVQLWDCFSGERTALPMENGRVLLNFAPGQERVLHIGRESHLPVMQPQTEKNWKRLGQPVSVSLDEPNIYVLDIADLYLQDQMVGEDTEILELDRTLRTKLGFALRGGEMLQPWAREKKPFAGKPIRLEYHIQMEQVPDAPLTLALEPMEDMELFLNGTAVPLKKLDRFWVDSCFALYELPCRLWQTEDNMLTLTASYGEESGLEAMYLLGEFGVWLRKDIPVMGAMPHRLKVGDIVHQGLPFYSGKVTYQFAVPDENAVTLRLSGVGGSCALATCGGETKMIPWEWVTPTFQTEDHQLQIQVVLNRRNTFGPLHRFPRKQPHIAPDSFTCDDKRYCLYPTGLLKAPEICDSPSESIADIS